MTIKIKKYMSLRGAIGDAAIFFLFLLSSLICISPAAAQTAPDITTGLVGHWTFDQVTGANDATSNGNNGVLSGSTLPQLVTTGQAVGNGAYSFNGSGYVDVGTNSALSGGNAITVSAWIKPNATSGYIVTHGDWNVSWDLFLLNSRINFDGAYDGSSWPDIGISGSFPINTTGNYWTHVVVTYTCNNGIGSCTSGTDGQLSLYINGVQDTGATINGKAQTAYTGNAPIFSGSFDTRIGARGYGDLPNLTRDGFSPFPLFSGSMDDVRIYSRALTSSDITALFGNAIPAASTDVYISQNGEINGVSGNGGVNDGGDGSSCSNSYSVNWLNALYTSPGIQYPLSWDPVAMPGQIYPGVSVHLCGIIWGGISPVLNTAGTGYKAGDVLGLSQSGGGSGMTVTVSSVSAFGAIGQFTVTTAGSGFSNTAGFTTNDISSTGQGAVFYPVSTGINIGGSGTAGNPITIKFEPANGDFPNAKLSAPAFLTAINGGNNSYITVDGCYSYGSEDSSGKCVPVLDGNGNDISKAIIENTNNGSPYEYWPLYCNNTASTFWGSNTALCTNLANNIPPNYQQTNTTGIGFSKGNNIIIKNLNIQNLYNRAPASNDPAGLWAFVTQDQVEYVCSSTTSCNETTPSGLNWTNVAQSLVNNGWATQPVSTILQATSQYNNDTSLLQHMISLFSGNAASAQYIINLFSNPQANGSAGGIGLTDASNVLIFNNTITEATGMVDFSVGVDDNLTIDSNTFTKANHFLEIGSGGNVTSAILDHITISNNHFDGYDVYGSDMDLGNHRNYIIMETDGMEKDINIYNNFFGPGLNPLLSQASAGTSSIYFTSGSGPTNFTLHTNANIYNNIFLLKSFAYWSDGFLDTNNAVNLLVANNTFMGGGMLWVGGPNLKVYNNLFYDDGDAVMDRTGDYTMLGGLI